ncbi:type II toxin-antitoxin system PemK/MazF family toxin [Paenibacillus sp. CGMCC 1.16610]|uniref:Type II toxin-antitoxin system PemK/MazF family toxin n=1 Tax=Paenibacillus anseongense TaxID=2682845 RepID=A0ABW9UKX8_9BACL|nr:MULTISPECIES: type II toxin-antitoxin system PemK/MazF family toxin [Paenibacillus]MBA2943500.1 type II toxin-antitoxin system PemK/MazF family toxin [Paenibacillus sp. CGMCC 1.16610]MVQ39651.1 hypothetical protein [Paenibacillus anseongense]
MFPIDRRNIKIHIKEPEAKKLKGMDNNVISEQWKLKMWNIVDKVQELSVYNMGQWVIFHDRWLKNLSGPENQKKYKNGDIVMADLGAVNFKYEPQYEHPCIVLVNDFTSVFVVPCSSKKYGQNFPDIIDATPKDGFQLNTGIQMNAARWINKNRITQSNGQITNPVLMRTIEEYILVQFPTYQQLLVDQAQNVAQLQVSIHDLQTQKESLEIEISRAAAALEIYKGILEAAKGHPELLSSLGEVAASNGLKVDFEKLP